MTDKLRRLLDAVLDERNDGLGEMAAGACTSPFHFARSVRAGAGESPVALRRRIILERAAWELRGGASVTDAAFAAGYESVEGFSRAFTRAYGHPPTAILSTGHAGHWLPAPNGIHFHSPTVLYIDGVEVGGSEVDGSERPAGDVLSLQIRHDVADIARLLDAAEELPDSELAVTRLPGSVPRRWDGPDDSLARVLWHLVASKEPWLASIAGEAMPDMSPVFDVEMLRRRHDDVSAQWLATIRDIDRRGGWADWIVDALCEPPESFRLSQIVAHELAYSTHRRFLARWMLADAGVDVTAPDLDPDPIMWQRAIDQGGRP